MKLKDGHTYITRSGVKRKVSYAPLFSDYIFWCASIHGDGCPEYHTDNGKFLSSGKKHKWDFVKEFK